MTLAPTEIRKMPAGAGMKIRWSDDRINEYPAFFLRDHCRCALCQHELTGEKLLKSESIPKNISIQKVEIVGQYALGFQFSDGHNTGIYTFEYLQQLTTLL